MKPKILIVDDERFNINLLTEILKSDYELMVALDGKTALAAAAKGKPDLVLLDILMPEMTGAEVCMKLKENPSTKDTPVVFITALPPPQDMSAVLLVGAEGFITKPFDAQEIKDCVKKALGN